MVVYRTDPFLFNVPSTFLTGSGLTRVHSVRLFRMVCSGAAPNNLVLCPAPPPDPDPVAMVDVVVGVL